MISTKLLKFVPALFAMALFSAGLTSVPVRDAAAQNDVVTKSLSAPFDKVATKLKRQIAAHKLVIVKEVPYQQMVAMVGLKTDVRPEVSKSSIPGTARLYSKRTLTP